MRSKRLRRWAVTLGIVIGALVAAVVVSTDGLASFGGTPSGERLARMQASPNFRSGVFVNAESTEVLRPAAYLPVLRAQLFGDEMRTPSCPLPMVTDGAQRRERPPESGLRITWLGHSTTLIEIDGFRVLTDPQWSARASPSKWVGPTRFHPPPLPLDALPPLDAVVISHDHYDHLDMNTVRALARRGVTFYLGLGVGAHLEKWGVPAKQIVEHDAWESSRLPGGLELVATPTRHFSGRGPFNRNSTRWTSWTLIGPKHRVFFSGDTGLTPQLAKIGERLGPLDVALIEIGAYHPAWGEIHLGPQGALEAYRLLGARRLFPIHWSTFNLAIHGWSDPAETLYRMAGTQRSSLVMPLLGEPVEPTSAPAPNPWWRELPPIAAACPTPEAARGKATSPASHP